MFLNWWVDKQVDVEAYTTQKIKKKQTNSWTTYPHHSMGETQVHFPK